MFKWFKRLIHKYDDYREVGSWGIFDVETKKSTIDGKMYSRTIKIENDNGSIGLDSEWMTDVEMNKEKNGEWIDPE